ncbi:MAG: hypothetical protein R6U50_09180 [Desulfobacterales bacterium]
MIVTPVGRGHPDHQQTPDAEQEDDGAHADALTAGKPGNPADQQRFSASLLRNNFS